MNADSDVTTLGDAAAALEGAITATGPTSEAAIAASGSEVLRQEQERGSDADLALDLTWCIGHICPSPCSQVHSAVTELAAIVARNMVGIETSKQRSNTSQPAAARASRDRVHGIAARLPQLGVTRPNIQSAWANV